MKLDPNNFVLATDYAQSFYGTKPPRYKEGLEAWKNVLPLARDDIEREGARVLMFTSEDFDLVLTVAPSSRGALIGGAAMSRVPIVVGIRRPLRATIVLRSDDNGVLVDTAVPSGASCVVVYTQDGEKGEKWESEWLTL
jgi:hypothetical protein